jgi:two-component system nitrate/nitrite sensor histidine kinase NarX
LPVTCTAEGRAALPPDVQIGLYRIAQEALNNAAKHAVARSITVTYEGRPGSATLTIADDGVGFDPAVERPGHLGLGIMQERAAAVGAAVTVQSTPGAGTSVTVRWPAARAEGVEQT